MGCMLSRPVPVSQQQRPFDSQKSNNPTGLASQQQQNSNISLDPHYADFQLITSDIRSICKIEGTNPVVCLSDNSFPIVSSKLFLDADNPTDISLPVVAAAKYGEGRILCFGHIAIFMETNRNTGDTEIFLSSAFQWAMRNADHNSRTALIVGFPPDLVKDMKMFIQQFSLVAESIDPLNDSPNSNTLDDTILSFDNYSIVFLASNVRVDKDKIEKYVLSGGILICLFMPSIFLGDEQSSFIINEAIFNMGVAFTYCSLLVGEPRSFRYEVPRRYSDVKFLTFQSSIESYISYLSQSDVEETKLDDLVTSLRFYLMVVNESQFNKIKPLLDQTWDFLKKTGCYGEKGIAPLVVHGICMILLAQLLYKIPLKELSVDVDTNFPGICHTAPLINCSVTISIGSFAWFSTGLWLPSGKIGKVRCQTPIPSLHVQIGSHQDSLLSKPGPWKRWPVIIMSFAVDRKEFEIASPFSGIIYIVVEMLADPNLTEIEFEFEGFCQHPRAVMGQPDVWAVTSRDNDVPWAELESPTFIISVPTSYLRQHETDIESYFQIFDKLVGEIINFTSCHLIRPYRIVFDIDLVNDEPGCAYPLVFSLDDLERILVVEQPTKQLFTLMKMLTNISVRENCFDASTEDAIATVSACSAIKEVWPNANPLVFLEGDTPALFNELWELHIQYDATILPKTLAVFQDPEYQILDTPEDMWILFVRELCRVGKKNFTPVLQRARPIPLNISISLQNLPDYKGAES